MALVAGEEFPGPDGFSHSAISNVRELVLVTKVYRTHALVQLVAICALEYRA